MTNHNTDTGQRTFVHALEKAISHSGIALLDGETQLYSLVADYLGGSPQGKQSLNLLRNAIDCGIPARMHGAVGKDTPTQTITVATCRKLLMDGYGISEEAAGRFMEGFAEALGWNVIVEQAKQVHLQQKTAPVQPKPTPVQLKTAPPQPKRNIDFSKLSFKELQDTDHNNPEVQFYLGLCYYNGRGVKMDWAEAVRWYQKAVQQGHAGAQCELGYCYYNGDGVEKDLNKAAYWYKKAADQDHADAQFLLGKCYYGAEGSYMEAVRWFQKAADQGHAKAQFLLGLCYHEGDGVKKDLAQAAHWFQKSAAQGNSDAQYMYGRMTSKRS